MRMITERQAEDIADEYNVMPRTLTTQEEKYISYRLNGMPVGAAIRAAGFQDVKATTRDKFLNAVYEFLVEKFQGDLFISKNTITQMLMDSYAASANATEMMNAAEKLGKLHGHFGTGNSANIGSVTINQQTNNNGMQVTVESKKELSKMDDASILALAGDKIQRALEMPGTVHTPPADKKLLNKTLDVYE